MKKSYDVKCGCGAEAHFEVEFSTFNQQRVNDLLHDLEYDMERWQQLHKGCLKDEAGNSNT